MRIPETPSTVENLDLMKCLEDYSEGRATWSADGMHGQDTQRACRVLHTNIVQIVQHVFSYVLDRVTSNELDTFTMHDRRHGLKVSHLMWHILAAERRARLTPVEIALLVLSAHIHDAGMALSREERERRLAPDSDLWERLQIEHETRTAIKVCRDHTQDPSLSNAARIRAEQELFQAEQFLLALDTRERHATRERYEQLLNELSDYHDRDRARIPDIDQCLAFDGDSFRDKLIEICVSHNQGAEFLIERDPGNFELFRLPSSYPVGASTANLHFVAAALRLADILDFDRERTPALLYHYLIPSELASSVNISSLEWNKHLSISNWEIDRDAIVFRGRCASHIVHHAVVQFARTIEEEISSTKATFGTDVGMFPFCIPDTVNTEIISEGYHYIPYHFELDDGRVYSLLMGKAIYTNPLDAIRELIQNAVDACGYRDALSRAHNSESIPSTINRIAIEYHAPTGNRRYPHLVVTDSGTGMDKWVIEKYFLAVGRSYYTSTEFLRDRIELRKHGQEFAPVSEFGIGFLSCFLLGDRVEVETAMWEPLRGDTRKRHLIIDGPARLIRLSESQNEGMKRFRGTRVTIHLTRSDVGARPGEGISWDTLLEYVKRICQELPYSIAVVHCADAKVVEQSIVEAKPLLVQVPTPYAHKAFRLPLRDPEGSFEGEMAIVSRYDARKINREIIARGGVDIGKETTRQVEYESTLLRGGFNVGNIPGLPDTWGDGFVSARLRLNRSAAPDSQYLLTNLARTQLAEPAQLAEAVYKVWLEYLIDHASALPEEFLYGLSVHDRSISSSHTKKWLEKYDAQVLYNFGRSAWRYQVYDDKNKVDRLLEWENGSAWVKEPTYIYLFGELLHALLPRIVKRRRLHYLNNISLCPPVNDWREVLNGWKTFVTEPVQWSKFVEFEKPIEDLMYYESTLKCFFNEKYAENLVDFGAAELAKLESIFNRLLRNRPDGRPTQLAVQEVGLFQEVIHRFGNLVIGNVRGTWPLASFGLLPSSADSR